MEFIELGDYRLPAGRVTEWTPSTHGDGECWAVDDRPLTYVHEHHFARGWAQRECNSPESSWLGGIFEVHDRYDPHAMARALRCWMLRHEALRTTVSKVVDAEGAISLARLTNTGCVLDIRPRAADRLATGSQIHQHLTDLFDSSISPLDWPHCLVATITEIDEGLSGDGFVVVFAADHSVMDAYSMLLSINEIQQLYAFELHGVDPGLPEIGSHIDFSVTDRLAGGDMTTDHRAVRTWERFLAADGGRFPTFPLPIGALDAPHLAGSVRPHSQQASSSSWLLSADAAAVINAHSRRLGLNLQAAVLAALAVTNRALTGSATLRFAMPVHTRYESQYVESVGWYVGIIPVEIDIAGAATIGECMAAAAAAVSANKELSRYPYPRVAQLLEHEATPRFVVSYLDVRFVPGAQAWERWRAQTLRSAAHSDQEVYFWIARTPEGVTISARFPNNEVASANVRLFTELFGAQLSHLTQEQAFESAGQQLASYPLPYSQDKFPA
jgi:hypothetical protein